MHDWWSSERSRICFPWSAKAIDWWACCRNRPGQSAKPQLILVDHNELGQAVLGADEADILEVLDHHRIGGGLKTAQPIRFINDPVGSTCTLVARQFRANGIEPNAGVALCMASGIISDTLFLRSPTHYGYRSPMLGMAETSLQGGSRQVRQRLFRDWFLASFVHFDRSRSRGLQRI